MEAFWTDRGLRQCCPAKPDAIHSVNIRYKGGDTKEDGRGSSSREKEKNGKVLREKVANSKYGKIHAIKIPKRGKDKYCTWKFKGRKV